MYNVLDGKQRTLTLHQYVNNEFALSKQIRIHEVDGHTLDGLEYKDLPEKLQKRISDYQLSIMELDKLNADNRAIVFYMRNQSGRAT